MSSLAARIKAAFAVSQYSGALNPLIESQASYQPPRKVPRLDVAVQKTAAGAPTRGNFMMASDIPAFRKPRLDVAVQKEAAKKYAMPVAKLAAFVATLKQADASPAVAWNGGTNGGGRMVSQLPAFSQPSLEKAIQKRANVAMGVAPTLGAAARAAKAVGGSPGKAAPGPSIAQIAKPKGPHMGSGIAGAFKGGIGGTAPVSLS